MREVVKAPSMAKFSAVLTPPAPRLSPVGFFRARRVKPNRPRQLPLFSWCRRKTTAAEFHKNRPWQLDRGGRNTTRPEKPSGWWKKSPHGSRRLCRAATPECVTGGKCHPHSQIFGDFTRLRFAEWFLGTKAGCHIVLSSHSLPSVCFLLFSGQHVFYGRGDTLGGASSDTQELLEPDVIVTKHKKK